MSSVLQSVIADLAAETDALAGILRALPAAAWHAPTPAEGWTLSDQVAHLVMFDERCMWGISDPERFTADRDALAARGVYASIHDGFAAMDPTELLERWVAGNAALCAVGLRADPKARCMWYGPSMSAVSMLTARVMETWAHGWDICDATGARMADTDRLRHVAHIAVGARAFSYAANTREMPQVPVRVQLDSPSGDTWVWGEGDDNVVTGSALGFCLAATQRRHVDDCGLTALGDAATEWLGIIQAFAGPPGAGRAKGQFPPL